jgi:hypothetical protein
MPKSGSETSSNLEQSKDLSSGSIFKTKSVSPEIKKPAKQTNKSKTNQPKQIEEKMM